MPLDSPKDTIAALATPAGSGALAVVRMSGAAALAVAGSAFRGSTPVRDLAGFSGAHGWIWGNEGPRDEVVLWVYRAPRSYTGEDMIEISCHGGPVPGRRVLAALYDAGARPAEPGEFTRRAFVNGKLDLAQAEAVAALIAARGRRAQEQALLHLRGGLSARVRDVAGRVRGVLAEIEAHLDFGEDVPEPPQPERLRGVLAEAREGLGQLGASHGAARALSEGWAIVFAGRPNVGKSSLLNALVGHDRALVHETPGTTRDIVEAWVEWGGISVRLLDTAGLREDAEAVERAGIDRARREAGAADRVLWVVDASMAPDGEDRALAATLDGSRLHLVLNKMDLPGARPEVWADVVPGARMHRTSARTGSGVGELIRALTDELLEDVPDAEGVVVTSDRHARLLEAAREALGRAHESLRNGHPLELGAADLRHGLDALAAITGDQAGPELLDEVFRRFCIGK